MEIERYFFCEEQVKKCHQSMIVFTLFGTNLSTFRVLDNIEKVPKKLRKVLVIFWARKSINPHL